MSRVFGRKAAQLYEPTKMPTEFEIIKSHLRKGSFADCLRQRNTKCLNGKMQQNVWMIQGAKGISAYYDLTQRIHRSNKIQDNYTIKHVEKILDFLILDSLSKPNITQDDIIKYAKKELNTGKLELFADFSRSIWMPKIVN